MEIKKIMIVGDSFMAPDPFHAPGKHFSELLGIESLASIGCSNINICFQIKETIKQRADYVIIGPTDCTRLDLNVGARPWVEIELSSYHDHEYISATIPQLIDGKHHDISDSRRLSIKHYFTDVFDRKLKDETDSWALGYWYNQLKEHGIQYQVLPPNFCIYEYAKNNPTERNTFHTDLATQELAASILSENLK